MAGGVKAHGAGFDEEAFVVHFVEVEDGAHVSRGQERFNRGMTHLGGGSVFDHSVEV